MSGKDDDQLLQDASTLLMFANVAAKQQSNLEKIQSPTQVSDESIPQPKLPQQGTTTVHKQGQIPLNTALPRISIPYNTSYPPQRQLPQYSNLPIPQNTSRSSITSLPQPPNLISTNSHPHSVPSIHSITLPTQRSILAGISSLPPLPNSIPGSTSVLNATDPQSPKFDTFPRPMVKISPKQPIRRSSIILLMNADSSDKTSSIGNNLAGKTEQQPLPIVSSNSESMLLSHKSASTPITPVISNQTMQRSKSQTETGITRILQSSPNQTLQKGINMQTGERESSNAMIAAAALAAAAEVPFPLKREPIKQVFTLPQPIAQNVNQPQPSYNAQHLTSQHSFGLQNAASFRQVDTILPQSAIDAHNSNDLKSTQTVPTSQQLEQQKPNKKKSPVPRKSGTLTKKPTAKKQTTKQEKINKNQNQIKPTLPLEVDNTKLNTNEEETEPEDNEDKTEEEKERALREQYNIPPFESYKAKPDSILIECICGIEEDDGFTVQCDLCFRWQHCNCMGFDDSEELPDIYKCYYCDKSKWGKFDAQQCRHNTRIRLHPNKRETKRKQLSSDKLDDKYKTQSSSNNGDSMVEVSNKRRKTIENDKRESNDQAVAAKPKGPFKDNELLKDGLTAESYQSVYFTLKENDYKRPHIKDYLIELGIQFYENFLQLSTSDKEEQTFNNIEILTLQQFKAIKYAKLVLPNYQKYKSEHFKNILKRGKNHNPFSIKVRPYSDNQKLKFNGFSKVAMFIFSSDELVIPEDTPVIEYLGEIDLFENYARDKTNQYPNWGTTKPAVLKSTLNLHEKVSVVLDSRFVGNESRFIRNSCPATVNCKIKQVYIPETKSFKFIVVTSKEIILKSNEAEEELRLNWEWDHKHPILQLYENSGKVELLPDNSKNALILYLDNMSFFTECGCTTSNLNASCALNKVKKAAAHLLRSTRKVSGISNINLSKSKEEFFAHESKQYVSWDDRLAERSKRIEFNLLVTNNEAAANSVKEDDLGDVDIKAEAKPAYLMKIPYKEQLRLCRELVVTRSTSPFDGEPNEDSELAVPLISDIAKKIEETIDSQLKPIEAEIKVHHQADGKENKPTEMKEEKVVDEVVPSEIVEQKLPQAPEPKAPPKLSLADYMKKRK